MDGVMATHSDTCRQQTLIPRKTTEMRNDLITIVELPSHCEHNHTEHHTCIAPKTGHARVHTCGCGWEWTR